MARLPDPLLAERRRRQIMDAAVVCFRRRGFHQATMQEICSQASISAGALYRYFDSKAAIIAAIAEDERAENENVFRRATGESVLDRICEVARGFFRKIADGDASLIAEVYAEAARDPLLARALSQVEDKTVMACAEMISAAQERGEASPDFDPEECAHALFAAIEGVGLRSAMLGRTDIKASMTQFRAMAERYLMVCA